MKLFLLTAVVVPIADLSANHGRIVETVIAMLMAFGHTMSNMGAAFVPSV